MRENHIESVHIMTKWPEYHFLSPLAATMRFANLYREMAIRRFATVFGSNRPEKIFGFKDSRLDASGAEFTSMNRARQLADDLGARYEDFISISFDFWFARQRPRIPRPNQLGPVGRYPEQWMKFFEHWWSDRQLGLFSKIDSANYRFERYLNLPAQMAFRELAVRVVEGTQHSTGAELMRRWTIQDRLLPVEEFRSLMRPDVYEGFLDDLKPELEASGKVQPPRQSNFDGSRLQSCFGLPGAQNVSIAPCSVCPLSKACDRMASIVSNKLHIATGSTDPKLQEKRDADAKRQRRHRERIRASAAALCAA